MHHWAGKHAPLYENVDSRKSVELASSRNLLDWDRVAERAPFMELSPVSDGETYDTGQIVVLNRQSSATMSCGSTIWASGTVTCR